MEIKEHRYWKADTLYNDITYDTDVGTQYSINLPMYITSLNPRFPVI